MMALFLNFSDACHALPAQEQRHGGENFLVLHYACGVRQWQVWQRECIGENKQKWWGRPFYMVELHSQMAFYHNRFGELQGGYGALQDNAYVPLCGS